MKFWGRGNNQQPQEYQLMTRDEIMDKLGLAMAEVDKELGPIEPSNSQRPQIPMVHQDEPVEPTRVRDELPGTLPDWIKQLSSEHKHLGAQLELLQNRMAAERESLATQVHQGIESLVAHQVTQHEELRSQLTLEQGRLLERLEAIAKFLGL
jgi:hypothetical protein